MIRILGAGAWGTALAVALGSDDGAADVELVSRTREGAEQLRRDHVNRRRLAGVALPAALRHASLDARMAPLGADDLLVAAVPSESIADVLAAHPAGEATLVIASKGLDASGRRPSQSAAAAGVAASRTVVLSGPNLAHELARGLPAAAVLAGPEPRRAGAQAALARPNLRLYPSDDLIGVEICGALKNVVAIAVSAVRTLGYGENASAALLARGVAEMARLAEACGGRSESAFGLAGVGDLVLTASNTGSRNARLGELLARGTNLSEAVATIGATIEGITTAHGALELAGELHVELPIVAAVVAALEHHVPVEHLARGLLGRAPAAEFR